MSDDVDTTVTGAAPAAERAARPFFHSRWVQAPAHVRELGLAASLPAGFRAAGAAAGIKPSGNPDVGLLVCDAERPVSAARFTTSAAAAAPVLVSRERCQLRELRAVLVNSGCANAATGQRGLDDAAKTQGAAAAALGLDPAHVALASTGGISQYLPVEQVLRGILEARPRLSAEGAGAFQRAIQTTDAFEKRANLEVQLPGGVVRLSAQCKGAGMISPRFATMLCFVQTDALLSAETAELLLGVCVKRSFDRVSVDGQLSTNDTAILMCSGASGVEVAPQSEEELRLGEALDALLRALAIMLVADGEGAARIARVLVRGGEAARCEAAARAVANSPLVKAALHGGDPNWGRIVQAVGGALGAPDAPTPPLALDVAIEGIPVCSAGAAIPYDEPALARAVAREEVEYEVTLGGRDSIDAETEVFFSDLSREYVTVNAEYTT
ncbi:MAG TPA: bifunctional glutamate N-acetyltransferase/amino-acid acetyltransferase ArgJ [Solirubrobacteraceae bacterium]|jgi:glutamate N-acetyltransferase/amino-acid N-acetyltransferase|nr:bifunctional glutamate N-acetyltransferase/amino-acid acetyltransferase ArgJ [Solirubrobacteraceae bacterium]